MARLSCPPSSPPKLTVEDLPFRPVFAIGEGGSCLPAHRSRLLGTFWGVCLRGKNPVRGGSLAGGGTERGYRTICLAGLPKGENSCDERPNFSPLIYLVSTGGSRLRHPRESRWLEESQHLLWRGHSCVRPKHYFCCRALACPALRRMGWSWT